MSTNTYTKKELEDLISEINLIKPYGLSIVDTLGNICGRVGNDHNGECIKGVLQDDWELLDSFQFPDF